MSLQQDDCAQLGRSLNPRVNLRHGINCYVHGKLKKGCAMHTHNLSDMSINIILVSILNTDASLILATPPSICTLLLLSNSVYSSRCVLPGRPHLNNLQTLRDGCNTARSGFGKTRCCICCNPAVHASASNTLQ